MIIDNKRENMGRNERMSTKRLLFFIRKMICNMIVCSKWQNDSKQYSMFNVMIRSGTLVPVDIKKKNSENNTKM